MRRRTTTPLVALAAAAMALTGTVAPASAEASKPSTKVLAKGLLSPLRAAVAPNGTAYVTQDFKGQLMKVVPGKKPKRVYASKGGAEVGAVSVHKGVVTFAESHSDPETGAYTKTLIKQMTKKGKVRTIADLLEYEAGANPDGEVTYGIPGLDEECAAQWPVEEAGPANYTGIVDSHPYATQRVKGGKTYVADAAMNTVMAISAKGEISTVAVLPPTPVEITEELAAGFGVPECAVGETYGFESVPTDVELGPDGKLYVSTLGGAAGEALPVGAVYRVDPRTGDTEQVFSGLMGAVGVAVAPNRDIYATQLFGGSIVKVKSGTGAPKTFVKTPMPAEVEVANGKVYATVNAMSGLSGEPGDRPDGRLVIVRK